MTYGNKDGECHRYSKNWYSHEGSDKCIQCPHNQVSFQIYGYGCANKVWYGCRYCSFLRIKDENGDCVKCNGPMEYNDVKGATKCKTCPLGTIPSPVHHHKCIECNPGFYGTALGKCKSCMIWSNIILRKRSKRV